MDLCGKYGFIRTVNDREKIGRRLKSPTEVLDVRYKFQSPYQNSPITENVTTYVVYWVDAYSKVYSPLLFLFGREYVAFYKVTVKYDREGHVIDCWADRPVDALRRSPLVIKFFLVSELPISFLSYVYIPITTTWIG